MKLRNLKSILNQEPAVNLLTLALKKNRLSHAYLFTGPKGVGKETTAWAFLFHLFCKESREEPCGICSGCKKIEKDLNLEVKFREMKIVNTIREAFEAAEQKAIEEAKKAIKQNDKKEQHRLLNQAH